MTALAALQTWISSLFAKPPIPLQYMRVGPEENADNPLMVSNFVFSRTDPADDPREVTILHLGLPAWFIDMVAAL